MAQKQSPRAPLHLKTTVCSEANSQYRSPRLENDRRSPRSSPHSEVPKKRGAKVADLETKLGEAQEELKKLKEQLASAETAKRDAQQELAEARKLISVPSTLLEEIEGNGAFKESAGRKNTADEKNIENVGGIKHEESVEESIAMSSTPTPETSEVVGELEQADEAQSCEKVEKIMEIEEEEPTPIEKESNSNFVEDSPALIELKAKLFEKEQELKCLIEENESLKKQAAEVAAAKSKEDELDLKLSCMENELREIRTKAERLKEQLKLADGAKSTLEAELRRLRVQTDQWRKAAETAAAVLTADNGDMGMDSNGRRFGERCGSLDKPHGYENVSGGYLGLGSPLMPGDDDELGSGKRRSGAIRIFGDLWKKRSQQK